MRRVVMRIVVCLVVGVVVNVLVAWGAVFACASTRGTLLGCNVDGAKSPEWPVLVPRSWPERADSVSGQRGFGVEFRWYAAAGRGVRGSTLPDFERRGAVSYRIDELTCGVPFAAFHSWERLEREESQSVAVDSGEFRVVTVSEQFGERGRWVRPRWTMVDVGRRWILRLPVVPDRIGFVANTLIYGAACWGLVFAPGVIRACRRAKRGWCIGCGYELAGLVRCPECGR